MQKEVDVLWLYNEFSAETKRLFKLISIFEGAIIWAVVILLIIMFSSLILLLIGALVHILFFIPIHVSLRRAPLRVRFSQEGIHYTDRKGSEGVILWGNVHSIRPVPMTKKREYVLLPATGAGYIYLNKSIVPEIKKRWEEYLKEKEKKA